MGKGYKVREKKREGVGRSIPQRHPRCRFLCHWWRDPQLHYPHPMRISWDCRFVDGAESPTKRRQLPLTQRLLSGAGGNIGTRGGFFSAADLEAFGAILDCHMDRPDSGEQSQFDDEEEEPIHQHEMTAEERERDRLRGAALDSWRRTASDAEKALLTEHGANRMHSELVPYLEKRFPSRFGVGVKLESILQKDVDGERLFTYDDHTAQTKYSKSGLAFGEKVIRNVEHLDRMKLIDSMAEHFREECEWECERLQTVLLRAGEEAVTRLRSNGGMTQR